MAYRLAARPWLWRSRFFCWPRPVCLSTSGFVAKFEVIAAAIDARSFWLAIVAMVSAVVSAFLYLRIMLSMYLGTPDEDAEPISVPIPAAVAILIAIVVTIGAGVVPDVLDQLARDAVPQLAAG